MSYENTVEDIHCKFKESGSRGSSNVDGMSKEDIHPGLSPKAQEPGSRAGSDVDGMSKKDIHPGLFSKLQEPGSRAGSDVDGMSKKDIHPGLFPKAHVVSRFPESVSREVLKAMAVSADTFALLMQENEKLQAEETRLKAVIQWQQQKLREQAQILQEVAQKQAQVLQEVAQLRAENQEFQKELQGARRSQGSLKQLKSLTWSKTDFHIQVRVTGKTGGCESQFIKKVSDHLRYRMNLKVERYQEDSGRFLLIFCPVATSVASDMDSALEGLGSEPKAVLVMLHHKLKESTSSVDTRKHAQHPAVVRTVHARYALEEGFYACPMNEEAVDIVAKVLKDHC